MKKQEQPSLSQAQRIEDILQKLGRYSSSANNRRIMHDTNNLITSLVLQHSMCVDALRAGDKPKTVMRLERMDDLIVNLETFARTLPKRIRITPEPDQHRVSDIISGAREFIDTSPSLGECPFELDLESDDNTYFVDQCFIQVLLIALTRRAVLTLRNPRVIINGERNAEVQTFALSAEARGEGSIIPEAEDQPEADYVYDDISLHSLQRIASDLHPSLKLQCALPPALSFSCQLGTEQNEPAG